jgi:hypothetical protein
MRRWWSRLLDGEFRWGSVEVRPDRFGVTRYRLVVYPPGINQSQRRWVRVWRGSPLWGALLWIVLEIVLGQVLSPWPALAIASMAYILSGAIALILAGDVRTQVRSMGVMVMAGRSDAATIDARNKLEAAAAMLLQADERLAQGQISPTEHELTWWRAYDQMGPGRSATSGTHWSRRSA